MKIALIVITAVFLISINSMGLPLYASPALTLSKTITTPKSTRPALAVFFLRANKGVIKKVNDHYELGLTGIEPDVIYSIENGAQESGFLPLEQFIESWRSGAMTTGASIPIYRASFAFAGSLAEKNGLRKALDVELSKPILWNNTLKMLIKLPDGQLATGDYKKVILFVKDVIMTPCQFHFTCLRPVKKKIPYP
jgi:hypothetical protein